MNSPLTPSMYIFDLLNSPPPSVTEISEIIHDILFLILKMLFVWDPRFPTQPSMAHGGVNFAVGYYVVSPTDPSKVF